MLRPETNYTRQREALNELAFPGIFKDVLLALLFGRVVSLSSSRDSGALLYASVDKRMIAVAVVYSGTGVLTC